MTASERQTELAKTFLSALFMGIRTARIHDTRNRAFENAVRAVYDSSQALFAATSGFRLVFIGDTTLLNDQRLRIDSSTFAVTRTLRAVLEAKKLGGIALETGPTFESSQGLIRLLTTEEEIQRDALSTAQIVAIPPQAFVDDRRPAHVDPESSRFGSTRSWCSRCCSQFERFEEDVPG
ncbi:MAG: hypothetical protein HC923_06485, partial [Myxococcales bacterium]|nr:hypothetical protein [Myxococcales bacterium]